jgi:hypothetical protein
METDTNSFLFARDVDPSALERRAADRSGGDSTGDVEWILAYRPSAQADDAGAFETERIIESYQRPVAAPTFSGEHFRFARWLPGPLRRLAIQLLRWSVLLDRRQNEHRARAFRALAEETGRLRREVAELKKEIARLNERSDPRGPA